MVYNLRAEQSRAEQAVIFRSTVLSFSTLKEGEAYECR